MEGAASRREARPPPATFPGRHRDGRCTVRAGRSSSYRGRRRPGRRFPAPSAGSGTAEPACDAIRTSGPGRQRRDGRAGHVAQDVSVGRLLSKRPKRHQPGGSVLRLGLMVTTRPCRRSAAARFTAVESSTGAPITVALPGGSAVGPQGDKALRSTGRNVGPRSCFGSEFSSGSPGFCSRRMTTRHPPRRSLAGQGWRSGRGVGRGARSSPVDSDGSRPTCRRGAPRVAPPRSRDQATARRGGASKLPACQGSLASTTSRR